MSMGFSEFTLRLGAEPRSRDPEFLRARTSTPEHRDAALRADRFEALLEHAMAVDAPPFLLDRLHAIPQEAPRPSSGERDRRPSRWWPLAVAASLIIAVGAAGLVWRMNTHWASVPDYVVDHYRHDGASVLARAGEKAANDVGSMLAEFGVEATPALAGIVRVIKNCPTPDGKGVHMVIATEEGLVTLIYMPGTTVTDGELVAFDDREAMLVALQRGSAVLIGTESQELGGLHSLVQASLVPLARAT